ncbi:hypothetical protein SUGI_0853100 [Cryptomeria japonica]|nr:hypothetical protein SUGI_0853100 [Cryptomeria japonica]
MFSNRILLLGIATAELLSNLPFMVVTLANSYCDIRQFNLELKQQMEDVWKKLGTIAKHRSRLAKMIDEIPRNSNLLASERFLKQSNNVSGDAYAVGSCVKWFSLLQSYWLEMFDRCSYGFDCPVPGRCLVCQFHIIYGDCNPLGLSFRFQAFFFEFYISKQIQIKIKQL